jgi:DNA polymerase elongation subunit (family B)
MTSFHTEADTYDWVVFLPQSDGSGSYCSYFGRLKHGRMKIKGVLANRRTTPPYIVRMQNEMLEYLGTYQHSADLADAREELFSLYTHYKENLNHADLRDFIITRRIGRAQYNRHCIAQAVLDRYRDCNVPLEPGMDASFLVRDENVSSLIPPGIHRGLIHNIMAAFLTRHMRRSPVCFPDETIHQIISPVMSRCQQKSLIQRRGVKKKFHQG